MRHQKKKLTLDRKTGPRRALIRGLAESLIIHEKVVTTKAKATAARQLVERLVTTAKTDTLANRRRATSTLYTPEAVKKLFEQLGPRFATRPGGYTRLVPLKNRVGDGAGEVLVEFV